MLNFQSVWPASAAIDPPAGSAFFASYGNAPAIHSNSSFSDLTDAGTLELTSDLVDLPHGILCPFSDFALFGHYAELSFYRSELVRVRLADFTYAGRLVLNEKYVSTGVIDP